MEVLANPFMTLLHEAANMTEKIESIVDSGYSRFEGHVATQLVQRNKFMPFSHFARVDFMSDTTSLEGLTAKVEMLADRDISRQNRRLNQQHTQSIGRYETDKFGIEKLVFHRLLASATAELATDKANYSGEYDAIVRKAKSDETPFAIKALSAIVGKNVGICTADCIKTLREKAISNRDCRIVTKRNIDNQPFFWIANSMLSQPDLIEILGYDPRHLPRIDIEVSQEVSHHSDNDMNLTIRITHDCNDLDAEPKLLRKFETLKIMAPVGAKRLKGTDEKLYVADIGRAKGFGRANFSVSKLYCDEDVKTIDTDPTTIIEKLTTFTGDLAKYKALRSDMAVYGTWESVLPVKYGTHSGRMERQEEGYKKLRLK
jgi:hypothetical protein